MQKPKHGKKKKDVLQGTRRPIYKGASERKGKWMSELQQPHIKSRVWLGAVGHPRMAAAMARDVHAFNFREVAPTLPHPSTSVRGIRHAARKYSRTVKTSTSSCDGECESSSSSSTEFSPSQDCRKEKSDRSLFWDEEEVFNMPVLMNSMAEGLIITPPALQTGFNWVDIETTIDLSLW